MAMTGMEIDEKDQRTQDAEKIAAEMLDLPEAATKRRGSSQRRRKSVLLGVEKDGSSDEMEEAEEKFKRRHR